jgi:hypothetical protein
MTTKKSAPSPWEAANESQTLRAVPYMPPLIAKPPHSFPTILQFK